MKRTIFSLCLLGALLPATTWADETAGTEDTTDAEALELTTAEDQLNDKTAEPLSVQTNSRPTSRCTGCR